MLRGVSHMSNVPIIGNAPQGPELSVDILIRVMRDMTGDETAFNSPLDRTIIDLFLLMEQAKNIIVLSWAQQEQIRMQVAKGGKR